MSKESTPKKNPATQIKCKAPWRLVRVKPLDHYRLEVSFIDGTSGFVEMLNCIMSEKAGVFSELKDRNLFRQVFLEYGVATWPGEIDLAPDAMYDEIKRHGKWIMKGKR